MLLFNLSTDDIGFQDSGKIMNSVFIATFLAVVLAAPSLTLDNVTASVVFSEEYKHNGEGRHLQTCSDSDDVLDPTLVRTTFIPPFFGLPLRLAPLTP